MKAALEAWLLRRWYGGVAPGPGLRLLEAVHAGLRHLRRAPEARRLPVPVLVVGNLVAGGAGKTPLTIALATALAARGWRPGIASRGHGRRSRGPVSVAADTPVEACGDEPLLIARRTGLPVEVDADRFAAGQRLVGRGCDLVICDDGLQHARLARDLEIEVLDGVRRYGNGRLLPAGPLREPPGRPVFARVVNGGAAGEGEWPMRLVAGEAWPLAGGPPQPLSAFAPGPVHAVAGIGRPGRFFEDLSAAGLQVLPHAFPDHHAFSASELRFEPPAPVLMTEKDAVKCLGLAPREAWAVPVDAVLPPPLLDAIAAALAALRNPPA